MFLSSLFFVFYSISSLLCSPLRDPLYAADEMAWHSNGLRCNNNNRNEIQPLSKKQLRVGNAKTVPRCNHE